MPTKEVFRWDGVSGLGPFLSKETLSRLVRRVADGEIAAEHIVGLAPFLAQSDLVALIETKGVNGLQPHHLAGIAPFVPQTLIEKLVLSYKREPASH